MAADDLAARLARGAVAHREGRLAEAEKAYRQVLAKAPRHADALYLIGMLLGQRGLTEEAVAHLDRALAAAPGRTAIRLGLVPLLVRAGRLADAVAHAERAVVDAPTDAAALHVLGDALLAAGRAPEAVERYLGALGIDPTRRASYENAAVALREVGLLGDATWCLREGSRRGPPSAATLANLAGLLKDTGHVEEAIALYGEAIALDPDLPGLRSNVLYAHHYADGLSPRALLEAHVELAAALGPIRGPGDEARATVAGGDDRRLRVGYVSPDVRQHSVAYFLEPVLAHHAGVEVFVYADVPRPDAVTDRIAARVGDGFRRLVGLDDDRARAVILADRIDVLVDLAGHTAHNRLGVFAARAAPTQVTWLGYPGTTGVAAMDFRLTDAEADPPGAEDSCSEALVRLETGFLCYQPPADAPDVAPPPSGAEGPITFGSFNQAAKISPSTLRLWARVIAAVPGSRLLLKARGLGDASTVASLLDRAKAAGIDPARVECAGQLRDDRAHLGAYGRVDVALDPFPYNGTTTTCEALWMGVPTVVRAGDRHAARVGVSLLTRVGLPLIAASDDDYVALAAALAADRPRLASLRASLRARMAASSLCDAAAFTRGLERAYRRMHDRAL